MRPPMRIWQCVDGHPVCEKCRVKLDSKGCPSCNRSVEGRNIALGEKIKLSKRIWRNFLSGLPRLLDQRVLQLAGPYHHSHDGLDWCFNKVILLIILLDSRSLTGGLQSSDRPSSQVSRPRNYFPDRGPVNPSFLSILLFNRGSFQKRQLKLSFFPFQVSIFLK